MGGEGCTPGYWKQHHHFDSWVTYTTGQSFDAIFGVDAQGDPTLLDAVKAGGGGFKALGRHAVAALLNAANPDVNYLFREADVIAMVQDAYQTGDAETTKDVLAEQNEQNGATQGCPLN